MVTRMPSGGDPRDPFFSQRYDRTGLGGSPTAPTAIPLPDDEAMQLLIPDRPKTTGYVTTNFEAREHYRLISDAIHEAVTTELQRRNERLEALLAECLAMQRHDMIDRLRIIHYPGSLAPATIASVWIPPGSDPTSHPMS